MNCSLKNNLMAGNAAWHLSKNYKQLSTSTERLSSGLRVNGANDDAAGLAIRELMRVDITAYHQGARNVNDAISLIQTADGALQVIDEKLIRMKELAEQASTGTYDSTQRGIISNEYLEMAKEIDRIANSTDFNGIHLLNGNLEGQHDGSGINSTGMAKIHFGPTNNSAEDYYYIGIPDATVAGLFDLGSYVTGFESVADPFIVENKGDSESQNVIALPDGGMLVIINNHSGKSISLKKFLADGSLAAETTLTRPDPSDGTMAPMNAQVLPSGEILLAYQNWVPPNELKGSVNTVRFDSDLNEIPNSTTQVIDVSKSSVVVQEDMAMSITNNSVLVTAANNTNSTDLIVGISDIDGGNVREINLGASSISSVGRASTVIGNSHFLVNTNSAGELEGYFFDDDATTAPTPIPISSEGNFVRLTSVGNSAVLTYQHKDPVSGAMAGYARVIQADGTVGPETLITPQAQDAGDNYYPTSIATLKEPDQVIISYKNSVDKNKVFASSFVVSGNNLLPSGDEDLVFADSTIGAMKINSRIDIAVLEDGSVVLNWQNETGGADSNAMAIMKPVYEGGDGIESLSIETQEKAQKALVTVTNAIIKKENIRAHIGALQNRFEATANNIIVMAENLQAAESQISDVDVAIEMTNFIRNQILSQAGTAMLSQANSIPNNLMSIISN